jgi:hypothetical protein
VTQINGPSNGGGKMHRAGRKPLRRGSPDHAGDAISRYSITDLGTKTRGADSVKVPALDLVNRNGHKAVTIGRRAGGGFTVTMRFKSLKAPALQQAIEATSNGQPGSLIYAFRFFNGYRPSAAIARYDGSTFTFGFSNFENPVTCGGNASTADNSVKGKCETYTGESAPLKGHADTQSNSIRLSVPASYLKGLGKGLLKGKAYPGLVKAIKGTRFYDGTAFTFVNDSPDPMNQSWMQQVDNAPAFDFKLRSLTTQQKATAAKAQRWLLSLA